MYCQFYNGPLDGWEHDCVAAQIGEDWCAPVTSFEPTFCSLEELVPTDMPFPMARYQLVAQRMMLYRGMLDVQSR
jgi:hypothetical protein